MTPFLLFEEGGDLASVLARQVDSRPLYPDSLDQPGLPLELPLAGVAPDHQPGPQLAPAHRDWGPPGAGDPLQERRLGRPEIPLRAE